MSITVELLPNDVQQWERCEDELIHHGVPVPLIHRSAWIRGVSKEDFRFAVARNWKSGRILAGFPVEYSRARSLPGHRLLRITRFGGCQDEGATARLLDELVAWSRRDRAVLSLSLEVFSADDEGRRRLETMIAEGGFDRTPSARRYRSTLRVSLDSSEEELLRSFSKNCRRDIRVPEKRGYRIIPLEDRRWRDRMDELWAETFSRSGTTPPPRDWLSHLDLARSRPELYHIAGTFSPSYPHEDSLVAFASARHNGDHGEYYDAASTRNVEAGVPLSYAPMWALMQWAKENGCTWFDLGGIPETHSAGDPLSGISDFKRRFTEDVIEVGGEWRLRPRKVRALVSDLVSSSKSVVSKLKGKAP